MIPARRVGAVGLAMALLCACGGDESPGSSRKDAGAHGCAPGELTLDGAGCLAAGMQEGGCAAGEVVVDGGGCRPAGIPPEMCAQGFTPDEEGGCAPILPARPCPEGQLAALGETACHDVAPCAPGTWGDIPFDAETQYVDGSYAGGGSNGSQGKPWTTIQAGVDAAASGAIVAIAAGSYAEDVMVMGSPVRLWGRCPALVEIAGIANATPTVIVREGASGSAIRDLAVTSPTQGIAISGSQRVVVDRVRIHDTGLGGLHVEDVFGPTQVSMTRSLVEATAEYAVYVAGAEATIETTVVRDTRPSPSDQTVGYGLGVLDSLSGRGASVNVRSSVFERNSTAGVGITGSDATIEGSVVRDTRPLASDQTWGRGIAIHPSPDTGQHATMTVRSCVVDHNRDMGIVVMGAEATIEATTVRDTQPQASDQTTGRGIVIEEDPTTAQRGVATIRSSVVARNHESGILVSGSDATIEGTVVRDTQSQASDETFGAGIVIQSQTGQRANATVHSCVLDHNHTFGLGVDGSDATIEGTLVQNTEPQASDQQLGRGISIQHDPLDDQRSNVTVRSCVVSDNFDFGISVESSDATIEATVVRETNPHVALGVFGDGLMVWAYVEAASAVVTGSRIESSARAGMSSFGASTAVGATVLECNAFDLASESYGGEPTSFSDLGGNRCGCAGTAVECVAKSAGLEPPAPLP